MILKVVHFFRSGAFLPYLLIQVVQSISITSMIPFHVVGVSLYFARADSIGIGTWATTRGGMKRMPPPWFQMIHEVITLERLPVRCGNLLPRCREGKQFIILSATSLTFLVGCKHHQNCMVGTFGTANLIYWKNNATRRLALDQTNHCLEASLHIHADWNVFFQQKSLGRRWSALRKALQVVLRISRDRCLGGTSNMLKHIVYKQLSRADALPATDYKV